MVDFAALTAGPLKGSQGIAAQFHPLVSDPGADAYGVTVIFRRRSEDFQLDDRDHVSEGLKLTVFSKDFGNKPDEGDQFAIEGEGTFEVLFPMDMANQSGRWMFALKDVT